jgi:hypothetical protein
MRQLGYMILQDPTLSNSVGEAGASQVLGSSILSTVKQECCQLKTVLVKCQGPLFFRLSWPGQTKA